MIHVHSKMLFAIGAGFLIGALSAFALRVTQPEHPGLASGMLRKAGKAEIGGTFHLMDQSGHDFTEQQLHGKPSLIIFGYSASQDLTPAALNVISEALEAMGAKAAAVRVVLISLDWEHDHPDVLKTYLQRFHPNIIGLTGSEEEIRKVASSFKVFLKRQTSADGSVRIDHSQLVFALDSNGAYVSHLRLPISVTAVVSLLKTLLAS